MWVFLLIYLSICHTPVHSAWWLITLKNSIQNLHFATNCTKVQLSDSWLLKNSRLFDKHKPAPAIRRIVKHAQLKICSCSIPQLMLMFHITLKSANNKMRSSFVKYLYKFFLPSNQTSLHTNLSPYLYYQTAYRIKWVLGRSARSDHI